MHSAVNDVHTVEDFRQFNHKILCEKENLLADQLGMTEFPLIRGGELCGLHFSLRGPRNVRLGAIWAADQNVVYLYDARGSRYGKLRLTSRLLKPEEARAAEGAVHRSRLAAA
jgi:hypothetical protein